MAYLKVHSDWHLLGPKFLTLHFIGHEASSLIPEDQSEDTDFGQMHWTLEVYILVSHVLWMKKIKNCAFENYDHTLLLWPGISFRGIT